MNEEHIKRFKSLLSEHDTATIVQADNLDGDSLASSIILDEVLAKAGKTTHQYCAVDVPKYLKYINGWERVTNKFPNKPGLVILVDCSVKRLIEKPLASTTIAQHPFVALDHHDLQSDIDFAELIINDPTYAAATHLIYDLLTSLELSMTHDAAKSVVHGINSDTLGLVSPTTSARTLQAVADVVKEFDLSLHELDAARRNLSRKSLKIINYKADLMKRMDYVYDDRIALLEIPLDEIKEYSDEYNPSVLGGEDLRNAKTVRIYIALKIYDDRITGRIREIQNAPICARLAESFETGGGHPFAAGFKILNNDITAAKKEVVMRTIRLLKEYDADR